MIRIVKAGDRRIERFNARPAFPEEAEKAAAQVLADIRRDGDKAVLAAVAKFEGFEATKASQHRQPKGQGDWSGEVGEIVTEKRHILKLQCNKRYKTKKNLLLFFGEQCFLYLYRKIKAYVLCKK